MVRLALGGTEHRQAEKRRTSAGSVSRWLQNMSRQTRRMGISLDASNVYEMDPWKDDRCRDFIALNTIQRLRSYHANTTLPVEPINAARAKNLHLLPAAEPDERICTSEDGCAVDMARIIFFGPMAFVSKTSAGRMTASPHITSHSGSRGDTDNVEETSRASLLVVSKDEENGGGRVSSSSDGNKRLREQSDTFEAGATPLKRVITEGNGGTPSPQLPERSLPVAVGQGGGASSDRKTSRQVSGKSDVVKFSCAIVDTIVSYYQSLLTRGVVLDRFSSKDLAFSWWVVCRNMDVEVLKNHVGPTRRDTLLISLRHFYYELLSNFHPKKSVPQEPSNTLSVAAKQKVEETDEGGGEEDKLPNTQATRKRAPPPRKAEATENNVAEEEEENDEEKPRLRTRFDSTRNGPPPPGTRSRHRGHRPKESSTGGEVSEVRSATKPTGSGPNKTWEVSGHTRSSAKLATGTKEKATEVVKATVESRTIARSSRVSAPAAAAESNEKRDPPVSDVAEAPDAAKRLRPPRSACWAEIWRSIRPTRRRSAQVGGTIDSVQDGVATGGLKPPNYVASCSAVVERIHERMEDDPVYAALFTAFPQNNKNSTKVEDGSQNHDTKETESEVEHGMHPSLIQLLRYYHTGSSTPSIPLVKFDEENVKNEARQQTRPSTNEEELEGQQAGPSVLCTNGVEKVTTDVEKTGRSDVCNPESSSPLMHQSCPFSALTYAQRCLLTWEASLLLDTQQPQPARKRQTAASGQTHNAVPLEPSPRRNYYDYWTCQRMPKPS